MCQKLGKRKLKILFGDNYGKDCTRDEDGKARRSSLTGRRYGYSYGSYILNASKGLENRLWPDCSTNAYQVRDSKKKLLDKLENCWLHGQTKAKSYTTATYAKRRRHLARNNVKLNPAINR